MFFCGCVLHSGLCAMADLGQLALMSGGHWTESPLTLESVRFLESVQQSPSVHWTFSRPTLSEVWTRNWPSPTAVSTDSISFLESVQWTTSPCFVQRSVHWKLLCQSMEQKLTAVSISASKKVFRWTTPQLLLLCPKCWRDTAITRDNVHWHRPASEKCSPSYKVWNRNRSMPPALTQWWQRERGRESW